MKYLKTDINFHLNKLKKTMNKISLYAGNSYNIRYLVRVEVKILIDTTRDNQQETKVIYTSRSSETIRESR